MALRQIFNSVSISATSQAISLDNGRNSAVSLVTFMLKGDFDGAHGLLQLGASLSSGTVVWNNIASTTMSASGQVNIEIADKFSIRAVLYGMSAAASQSTSVDGWLGVAPL